MNDLFSNDFEVGALSIIIKNPSTIYDVPDLNSFMFSSTINKTLYFTIEELVKLNLVPEYNLLINSLKAKDLLKEVGGEDYINYLVNQDYDDSNLKEFEKMIGDSYKARNLLKLTSKIPELIKNQGDVDGAIAYIKNSVDSLSLIRGGESVVSLEDASKEAWEELVERVQSPDKIESTTGFKNLDVVTGGYWNGDLWVIAGRPGMGKTAFMINSALNGAKQGVSSLIFSLEMRKQTLIYRMLSMETGIPIFNIRFGILNQKQLDLVGEAMKNIKGLPIFIDSNFNMSISYITSTIRKYKKLHNISVVHVDYIQLLAERSGEATHELGRISRDLKLLSNDLDISVVMYSQLNRAVEARPDRRPILADLRQSGNLEEDPDVVTFLYRDVVYNKDTKDKSALEEIIRKQRNGPIGTIFSKFDEETNRISEK